MLFVHHLGLSQSERVVWLCEELDIPYELARYERDERGAAPPEYKTLHPAGSAPIIIDGDIALAESAAVMEYIIERHGEGRLACHKEDPNFADYLFWFHFANGSMMPSALVKLAVDEAGGAAGGLAAAIIQRGELGYALIEKRLAEVPYLAGERFTAADIFMVFSLTTLHAFLPRSYADNPRIRAYLARISARPAYQRAMKKADPNFPRKF
jgi:glutathione S-transferase